MCRAGGPPVADRDPEIGEDNARAAPVSAAHRKGGDPLRAGPEVVQIAPREPLAPRDLATRTRHALLASGALRGTQTRLTNAALAAARPRQAVIRASRAALQAARSGAKTLGVPAGDGLARRVRIAWRRRR